MGFFGVLRLRALRFAQDDRIWGGRKRATTTATTGVLHFAQDDGVRVWLAGGFGAHHHGVLGAEGDFGLGDYGVVGDEVQAPVLGDGG